MVPTKSPKGLSLKISLCNCLLLLLLTAKDAVTADSDDCSTDLTQYGMSPDAVKRSSVAAKLSYLVYFDENPELGEEPDFLKEFYEQNKKDLVFLESGIDAVSTTQIRNEFCVAAFRGTTAGYDDLVSNLDFDGAEFKMGNAAGNTNAVCDIHSGYQDSYFNFEHRSVVESFLLNCSESCPECDVVLTGHSQGGGLAEVAALYYKNFTASNVAASNPEKLYVITFGAPQSIGLGCSSMFTKQEQCGFYHYVMTMKGIIRGLVYDPAPMIAPNLLSTMNLLGETYNNSYFRQGGIAFLGQELFLNADKPLSLALGPFGDHRGVNVTKYDFTAKAHSSTNYMNVLEKQSESFPSNDADYGCYLPTNGFSVGSLCNTDEGDLHCIEGVSECESDDFLGLEYTCREIDGSSTTQSDNWDNFCPKPCADDEDFRLKEENKKDCDWVKKQHQKGKKICARTGVKDACPRACGICTPACANNEAFRFNDKNKKDCNWVKKRHQNGKNICAKVENDCPEACDACLAPWGVWKNDGEE